MRGLERCPHPLEPARACLTTTAEHGIPSAPAAVRYVFTRPGYED